MNQFPDTRSFLPGATRILCEFLRRRIGNPAETSSELFVDESVFRAARHHRVLPLLAEEVVKNQGDTTIPGDQATRCKNFLKKTHLRSLNHFASLLKLKSILDSIGVPFIHLKGQTLSWMLFEDLSTRSLGDIDIWIPEDRLPTALESLSSNEYHIEPRYQNLSDYYQREFRKRQIHITLTDPDGFSIELHWKLSHYTELCNVTFQEIYQNSECWLIQGNRLHTLPKPFNLYYLLIHGSIHAWSRLQWLYDIAVYTNRYSEKTVADVRTLAEIYQSTVAINGGLYLSHSIFGSPSVTAATPDNRLKKSLSVSLTQICQDPGSSKRISALQQATQLRLLNPRLRHQLQVLTREWLAPDDWYLWKLPDYCTPAYLFLRPFTWIQRKWSQRFGKKPLSSGHNSR